MPRAKPYHYLVDGLTNEKALIIKKGLSIVPDITDTNVNVGRSTIEVLAYRDVEANIKLACDVAGVHYRTRARR